MYMSVVVVLFLNLLPQYQYHAKGSECNQVQRATMPGSIGRLAF